MKNIRILVVVFTLLLALSCIACNGGTTSESSSLDGGSEFESSSALNSGSEPNSSTVIDSGNGNSSVEEECEHQAVIDEEVPPTCIENGLTEGAHCGLCGAILVAQEEVGALGHTEVIDSAVAPDCENEGLTEGKHCDVCGAILVAQEEVDALGHTEVIDSAVAPDCKNTGLTEGKHCDVCGDILVAQEVVPIGDHNIVNGVCSVCGFSNVTDSSYFNFYYLDDGTYEILARDSSNLPENIVLPSVYNDIPVTAIRTYGFYSCNTLKSVVIPNSITIIDDEAFQYCEALTSVRIGDGVKHIGSEAFYRCTMLSSLTIGKNVESIGSGAFADCESLTSVVIPNSVTVIEDAFANCNALTIYCEAQSKPDGWSNYWKSDECPVVWDCKNNDVADNGFIYTVVDGVRYSIKDGEATVARQSALANNGNIAYSITHNGNSYAVTTIGEYAYRGCYVSSVTIPNSVTYICISAFELCVNLTSIVIPDSVTYMDSSIFYGCASLSLVVIGNKIEILNPLTFSRCTSLVSITLPDSVWVVNSSAFEGCTALEEFIVSESSQNFSTIDGNLYNKRQDYLERYAPGKKDTSFVIPEGVTNVWGAFSDCQYLTTVTIPKSMTSIDYGAFANCYSLTTILLHDGITEIGERAFAHCGKLESIIIPEAVEIIGANVFYGCDSIVIYCEAQSKPNGWSSDWNSSGLPVYYYSETQPATSGNYWHYVNGEVVTW